ncbi:MAG: adenylate/guanylate cyclase domain-containing protein [Alphaproteobacteria bacterium]|nr:adenylate/guanylate cyclase domain-containing protein [Alphaproteobacteria bacterium]MDX5368826.1 adenylate/guanylate cyclase domain-containing protein [Alphaproteobacteria bacterium]MDX5463554.1 adenylate/guanylate cyclase domain-containing protein [Alphaproteobacteria bacterium]
MIRALAAGLLAALAAAAVLPVRDRVPVLAEVEEMTLDWRFRLRGPLTPGGGVLVVMITDETAAAEGGWPLPRDVLARAVTALREAGAAAIGLDLLLVDRDGRAAADAMLADALATPETAVIAVAAEAGKASALSPGESAGLLAASYDTVYWPAGTPRTPVEAAPVSFLLPQAPFRDAARLGHVMLDLGTGGQPRAMRLAVPLGASFVPALPVELVRMAKGGSPAGVTVLPGEGIDLGGVRLEAAQDFRAGINLLGGAGHIETVTLHALLDGAVDTERIAGRAVLIGTDVAAVGDSFATAFAPDVTGVEVLATVTDNLLTGRALRDGATAMALGLAAIFAGAVLAAAAGWWLPGRWAALAAGVLILAEGAAAQMAFAGAHLAVPVVLPALATALGAGGAAGLAAVGRARGGPARPAREGRQVATIMFVDMAGSTALAESAASDVAVDRLRRFHRMTEQAVRAAGGRVEKYMGDGAMAVFPQNGGAVSSPVAALTAARRLCRQVEGWNAVETKRGAAPVRIRIGVHAGPVTVARLGGDDLPDVTPTGDTVNVASRLEALAKEEGAVIAISDTVAAEAQGHPRARRLLKGFEELPPRQIRGRQGLVAVWVRREG